MTASTHVLGERLEIASISPVDLRLRTPRGSAVHPGERHDLSVWTPGGWVRDLGARVDAVTLDDDGVPVVHFALQADAAGARELARLLRHPRVQDQVVRKAPVIAFQERVGELGRIRRAVSALIAEERQCLVRRGSVRLGRVAPRGVVNGALPLAWEPVDGDLVLEPPFTLEAEGLNALYALAINRSDLSGSVLVTEVPRWVTRTRHRWTRRVRTPQDLCVRFRHPVWPEITVERPITDVSAVGIGIQADPVQDLLFLGLAVDEVEVWWGPRHVAIGRGSVRVLGDAADGEVACGLQVDLADAGQRARWLAFVAELQHAETRIGRVWTTETWDVYDESGYLRLSGRTPRQFAHLRAAFSTVSQRLDAAPDLGCQVVYPVQDTVAATATMFRPYRHTWFGYQLAKRPDEDAAAVPGGRILRELLLRCYEHAMGDPDLRWVMTYVQAGRRWSRLAFHDLAAMFVADGLAAIQPFHCVSVRSSWRAAPLGGVEVGAPRGREVELLLAAMARCRPAAYLEAFDLVADRFLPDAHGAYLEARGLGRDRDVLIARVAGRPVAGAILESAVEGLHLFGLFDSARWFPLAGHLPWPVCDALLEGASSWFAARGKSQLVVLDEWAALDPGRSPLLEDLGAADTVILSAERLPEQLDYLCEITAPKLLIPSGSEDP